MIGGVYSGHWSDKSGRISRAIVTSVREVLAHFSWICHVPVVFLRVKDPHGSAHTRMPVPRMSMSPLEGALPGGAQAGYHRRGRSAAPPCSNMDDRIVTLI